MPPMSRRSSEPPARAREQRDDEERGRDDEAVVDRLQQRALGALRAVSEKIPSVMKPSCATDE